MEQKIKNIEVDSNIYLRSFTANKTLADDFTNVCYDSGN